jgi:hypothetical protein
MPRSEILLVYPREQAVLQNLALCRQVAEDCCRTAFADLVIRFHLRRSINRGDAVRLNGRDLVTIKVACPFDIKLAPKMCHLAKTSGNL